MTKSTFTFLASLAIVTFTHEIAIDLFASSQDEIFFPKKYPEKIIENAKKREAERTLQIDVVQSKEKKQVPQPDRSINVIPKRNDGEVLEDIVTENDVNAKQTSKPSEETFEGFRPRWWNFEKRGYWHLEHQRPLDALKESENLWRAF